MVQSKNRYLNWVFVSENNASNSLNIPIWSQIEMDKNYLFVGSDDNFIYCIDKKDGSEIWRYQWFKIVDSDDDSEDYDYLVDNVYEYDEYGDEILEPEEYSPFGDLSYWQNDENDRSYGWNLLCIDDILCVIASAELHLVDIQTGLGIKKINLSTDQSFHISHGFIIYKKDIYEEIEVEKIDYGGGEYVDYEKQLSKSDITVVIENVKKGEVCFEEQTKIKELKSIKSYLNDFISNNYKKLKKKIDYIIKNIPIVKI